MSEEKFLIEKYKNGGRTLLLFLGMLLLMVGLGYLFFGITGLIWAAILGGMGLYGSYRIPAKMIMKMQGARPLAEYYATDLCSYTYNDHDAGHFPYPGV